MNPFILAIRLNQWPLLLDLLALSLGLPVFLWGNVLPLGVDIVLGIAAGAVLVQALVIHVQTGTKIRAWKLLCLKNQKEWRPDSFKVYFSAPCGRSLVRAVLSELGQPGQYAPLKKQFYSGFWGKADTGPSLVFIRPEEQKEETL